MDDDVVYNSGTPLQINTSTLIKLDALFNDKWSTSANATYGSGTYRVYAAALDNESNVLQNIDGSYVNATWNFTIDTTEPHIQLNYPGSGDTLTNSTVSRAMASPSIWEKTSWYSMCA